MREITEPLDQKILNLVASLNKSEKIMQSIQEDSDSFDRVVFDSQAAKIEDLKRKIGELKSTVKTIGVTLSNEKSEVI